MQNTHYLKGSIFVFLSAILFGSYGIWSKLLGPDFGVFYQGWVRSAIVLCVLIPIALWTKQWKRIEQKDSKWILILVLFGIGTQAPLYYAYTHAGIGVSSVIFFSVILLISYLIGWLLVGETITKIKVTSFILALVGLFLTFGLSIKEFSLLALGAAAVNGVASGGEVSITKKVTDSYSSLQIVILIWFGILVSHVPLSLLFGEMQLVPHFDIHWVAMLCFAVAGIFGFWLVVEGFKYVDASIGRLIGLFEIVFGIVFGIILFQEVLTVPIVLGAIFIICAVALPYIEGGIYKV